MTDGTPINEAAAINAKMISTLLVIYRVAHRALSAEERVAHSRFRWATCVPSAIRSLGCIITNSPAVIPSSTSAARLLR
jgi:hypothetical protein